MRYVVALLTLVLVTTLAIPVDAARRQEASPSGVTVLVDVGQSNAFGTATLVQSGPSDDRIWMLDDRGLRPANDPLHDWLTGHQGTGGLGPMMAVARRLLERDPSLTLLLVPCAQPGRIRSWQQGAAPVPGYAESSYARCLRWTRAAIAHGSMGGLFVYQGEADTTPSDGSDGYAPSAGAGWTRYYERLVADLRADLGVEFPAVHAQLATTTCGGPDWTLVKGVQATVSLPRTAMIRTDDIPLNFANDCIHHTAAGYQEVGRRFADAWWTLARPPVTCTTNRPRPIIERQVVGTGQMRVTVRAGVGAIYGVTFGQGQNVHPVTDLVIAQNAATFTLRRANPGAVHLPFAVADACGPWQTFIGGGPGAF